MKMHNLVTATSAENAALAVIGDDDAFAAYANAVAPRNFGPGRNRKETI
jgi:hypothetical protein